MKKGIIKTPDDIARLREGGALLSRILSQLVAHVAPGVLTSDIDMRAEKLMKEINGSASFKGYMPAGFHTPFNSTICACINDEVVHAPAYPGRVLKNGDIFSIDIGMVYKERFTDMAITVPVGVISKENQRLIDVTKQSLIDGIHAIRKRGTVRDIGIAVQKTVEEAGYSVVRLLVGHGVGYAVHEAPAIPNYDDPVAAKIALVPGMVIAIEPMVCAGNYAVHQKDDGWTIATNDKKMSAHFEHTVLVTEDGYEILTK